MVSSQTAPALDLGDIQSIILRRRPAPYVGCHLLLRVDEPESGRKLLEALLPYVVSAADYGTQDTWIAVAITYQGLRALEVPESSLQSFSAAFRAGMASIAEQVNDVGESAPSHWEAPFLPGQLHVALTLLSTSDAVWRANLAAARRVLDALPGIALLSREDFAQMPGARTPMGYRDGISFPHIAGNTPSPIVTPEEPIAPGEFLFGYPGEQGRLIPMPQPDVLGRNGTLVSFRKLHSNVASYRRFLRANSDPRMDEAYLAAKMVGRWRSGAPLVLAPGQDDPALAADLHSVNNFSYAGDPGGLQCPLGAHIRRMNPRDSPMQVMTNVKLHRIIRHGTSYGPELPPGVYDDDGRQRGIFFIFLSAQAPETFTFLKREWIHSGNFVGLGMEEDPIAGAHDSATTFTIPLRPIRRRLQGLERFTVTRGGGYGFVPSLSALRWLATSPADRR